MPKTTKKAETKVTQTAQDLKAAEEVKYKADKAAIEQELKNIYETYNSKAVPDTIKRKINLSMSKIADIMKMEPKGSNQTPQFKVEVLEEVKNKFKIDSEAFTIAYNYNNINAKESIEKGLIASGFAAEKARNLREMKADEEEIKDLVKDIVDKVDKMVDYNSADEKVIEKNINDISNKSNQQPASRIKQLINEGVMNMVKETDKQETKQEEKIIKKILNEEIINNISQVTERPETSMISTREVMAPKVDSQSETETTAPKVDSPIIERAYISEQQQMKIESEEPMEFTSSMFSQKMKEGKTKLSDLENNFNFPIQYPENLLKWINMIGGWEQYLYNRSKFGLIDDVKGDVDYLQNLKRSLIMVCGNEIGVEDTPVGNINQAVKELMIMKNCYYIYKFKSSLPPQYGLIINANRLMSFADILGKAATAPPSMSASNKVPTQKPIVKGKERLEFEEQKQNLIEQSMKPQSIEPTTIPKPDITSDVINKSHISRGNRGLLQVNVESLNKRSINQGSLTQADAIARGIKIMKPKKQFNRY